MVFNARHLVVPISTFNRFLSVSPSAGLPVTPDARGACSCLGSGATAGREDNEVSNCPEEFAVWQASWINNDTTM